MTGVLVLFVCLLPLGCEKRELIEPTKGMTMEDPYQIRVLLFNDITQCSLTPLDSFDVIDAVTGFAAHFSEQSGPLIARLSEQSITIGSHSFSGHVNIETSDPFAAYINNRGYRGSFTLRVNNDGRSFDVVNTLPVEAYLGGVIGSEMPSYWEPDALKAQAIAARTYCLFIKQRFGQNRHWDLRCTQASQVYRGIEAESFNVGNALTQTEGQVLTCKNSDGKLDIFPTYFSSTCGGHTEDSSNVFGDSYQSLKAVKCPYCRKIAQSELLFWTDVQFPIKYVNDRLIESYPNLTKLDGIKDIVPSDVSDYGKGGRINSVKIIGQNGKTDTIRGEDLRLTIDPTGKKIKSTYCTFAKVDGNYKFIAGRGYGHGVGMCQCGAQGMARKGRDFRQILAYYYPSSRILKKY